ncbi:GCN5 family N-acetyltransferase [Amylibacter ulvae]|uniref:GCN5 family N-acetyltransferase n=1 Tax=Paramylibacter ulvae TaxID=1651968 RepID=A0ABQ3D766_9RHOB|nr:GNAT family N-acetyltransferase [Amylibacter ulvae]GHA53230.1 GCN5 family N-acetyltransferase [Amylibacter ulvae]
MAVALKIAQPLIESQWRRLWRDYLAFYKTERTDAVYDATWARILDPEKDMYSLIAFDGDRAVGLVNYLYHHSFWDIEKRCYLNDLYVHPDGRNLGVGRAMIAAVVDQAKSDQLKQVYWLTAKDNTDARALYDKVAHLSPFLKYDIAL